MADGVMYSELHVLSGERQDGSQLVGVATSPVLSFFKRRRGQLFTILEPSLPGTDEICHRLIETIEDEYFRDPSRSVTNSLRQAVAAANQRLRAENSRTSPDRQLRVGLCCGVVRDGDIYIAQVAPANAFILHAGTVKRIFSTYSVIPDVSSNGTNRASDSLGAGLDPHINFAYSTLDADDLVVLASGPYWKLVPDRYIVDAARHVDPDMAVSELYGCYLAHARRPTTSVIVIRRSPLPIRQRRSAGGGPEDEPRNAVVEMSEGGTAVSERPPRIDVGVQSPRVNGKNGKNGRKDHVAGKYLREQEGALPISPKPSLLDRLIPRRRKPNLSLYPPGPPLEAVGRPSVRLKPHWSQSRSSRHAPAWLGKAVALAVLATILFLLGSLAINGFRSWQLGDPVALQKEAQEKRTLAASAPDRAASRALLSQSYELFNRSLRAKEDESTRAAALAVRADLDKIDKVVRVSQVNTLVDYSSVLDEKGDVTQLLLDGTNLYVLDEGLDRLYRYTLTPDGKAVQERDGHPVVVKRGDKVEGATIGDLLSLTWMPAGQLRTSPGVFVLESGRSILNYDSKGSLSRIEVAESQRWGSIQTINGFAGGLYLLDTKLKGVFYYPPTKNGYESEPYTIIDSRANVDLSHAVDIALDGNLYVLESGGTIKRFNREGRPFDFVTDLPDGPVKGPKALFASANTRSVYLLDTAGERILQLSPEGKLQRQFKADDNVSFKEIRDLFVDESGRKLYLLARNSLVSFDLPPMQ